MMCRVFFDAKATGHHGEYLENIIASLSTENSDYSLIICQHLLFDRLTQYKLENNSTIKNKPLKSAK